MYQHVFHIDNRICQLRFIISIYFGRIWAGFRGRLNLAWLGILMQFAPLAPISLFQCDDESLRYCADLLSKPENILYTLTRYKRSNLLPIERDNLEKNSMLIISEKIARFFWNFNIVNSIKLLLYNYHIYIKTMKLSKPQVFSTRYLIKIRAVHIK